MADKRDRLQRKAESLTHVSPLAEPIMGFKFGCRTNLKKGVLTNRDALCILFNVHGVMTRKQVNDAMMTWRRGRATYKVTKTYDRPGHRILPTFEFGAYLNLSQASTYFHCGPDFTTPGHEVYHDPGPNRYECTYSFRRHFWFRQAKGLYAVSLEGMKRLTELVGQGLTLVAGTAPLRAA